MSPLSPQERTPTHTESSRPPQPGRTTSHPQIAHKLGQQGPYGATRMDIPSSHREGWMGNSYHLSITTRHTHQLFLKPQPWHSSDQVEFTQARQKVKAQVTQLPMPLPQRILDSRGDLVCMVVPEGQVFRAFTLPVTLWVFL
jgi:hypothetical protein